MAGKTLKKRLLNTLIALALLATAIGLTILILYLMAIYRPGNYNARTLTREEQLAAENQMWKKSQDYHNYMNDQTQTELFTITFEQNLLNNFLLHDEAAYYIQKSLDKTPQLINKPQLNITPDGLDLMAQLSHPKFTGVITINITPKITPDHQLHLTINSIHAGMLPAPESIITPLFTKLADQLENRAADYRSKNGGPDKEDPLLYVLPFANSLLRNREATIPASFESFDRTATVTNITLENGKITFTIKPSAPVD